MAKDIWEYVNPQENVWSYANKHKPSIGEDVFGGVTQIAPNLINLATNIIPEMYGAAEQGIFNPKRAAQNIVAGLGEAGHGILSTPGNIRDWAVSRFNLPEETELFGKIPSFRLPEWLLPKEYDYANALGIEGQQPGDIALRSGVSYAPYGLAAGSSVLGHMGMAGLHAIGQNENPITAAGAVGIAGPVGKYIAGLPKRFYQTSPEWFGTSLANKFHAVQTQAKTKYDKIWNAPNVPKTSNWLPTNSQFDILYENGGAGVRELLNQYIQNPTLENLNFLSSEIGHTKAGIPKKSTIGDPAKTTLRQTLDQVDSVIKNQINMELDLSGNPKLKNQLAETDKWYKKNYVPFKDVIEDINKFEQGAIGGEDLAQTARNSREFRKRYRKDFPGINYTTSESAIQNAFRAMPVAGSMFNLLNKFGGG